MELHPLPPPTHTLTTTMTWAGSEDKQHTLSQKGLGLQHTIAINHLKGPAGLPPFREDVLSFVKNDKEFDTPEWDSDLG